MMVDCCFLGWLAGSGGGWLIISQLAVGLGVLGDRCTSDDLWLFFKCWAMVQWLWLFFLLAVAAFLAKLSRRDMYQHD